ncbi:hypothetical protein [Cuneatibacter caecimuris]|uniref:Uncharacterized protein n=1 Tax=Cuneatibacter caecimuris TaxID=1796618 RepID=A0A4V2F885_9FIRM|nr:hypothetical protein [Cuneatibacter caecimuris]RZT02537.1 hypothetical protein EV209_0656 [Cuneatibacter caecimuris]
MENNTINRSIISVIVVLILAAISAYWLGDCMVLAFPAGIGFIVDALDRNRAERN